MQGLLVKILSVGSVCRMRWFVPGCRAVDSVVALLQENVWSSTVDRRSFAHFFGVWWTGRGSRDTVPLAPRPSPRSLRQPRVPVGFIKSSLV